MAAPALRRAFTVFHLALGLGILFLAARTAIDGVTGAQGLRPLLFIGGGIEALGAALFIVLSTLRVGGTIMLLTMTTALILDSLSRHLRIDLIIYMAGTSCVMVHGAAWRARSSAPSVGAYPGVGAARVGGD
jgi:hypothetical protein